MNHDLRLGGILHGHLAELLWEYGGKESGSCIDTCTDCRTRLLVEAIDFDT